MDEAKLREKRPDVFSYHDPRLFLADQCAFLKATMTGFTVARLSQDAKLSKGYLSMVLKGERKLTDPALRKLLPHLRLEPVEQSYLSYLGALASAKSQIEKVRALEQMQKLRSYQKSNPNEAVAFRYLSRWYHVAIRELSALEGFVLDAKWIQARLRESVPLADIERALAFLVENGFLEVGADGKARPPERRLECIDEVLKPAMLKYHEQVFHLAIEHIPSLDIGQKHLNAHMTAMSYDGFLKAKAVLENALKEIVEIARHDSKPEALFQFSLLGFGLSEKGPRNE